MTDKSSPSNKRLVYWAGGLSIFTLITHAIDAPGHLSEWWVYGTIFLVIGAFQFFYGAALFIRPWRFDESGAIRKDSELSGRPYYILGIILNVLAIILYIISRTSGLPFLGPEAVPEKVTLLSVFPVIVSVPIIYCLVRLTLRTRVIIPRYSVD